jgi:hypothetical protein
MTSNMCGILSLSVLRGKIRGHYGIEVKLEKRFRTKNLNIPTCLNKRFFL